jgi:RNA polymerase sigma-70 factor (ECF subfamily)
LSTADPALTMTPARDSPSSSARSDAISDLIDREAGPLLDYFNRRTLSPDDAADLLGETLVVVWRRERSIPTEPVQARMWLYGVARKVLAGHRRSSRRLRGLTERLGAELLALSAPAVDDTAAEVQDLLALLSDTDQEIIRLVYWDGFSLEEVASIMSMRPGTVRSRHSRARARLRILMGEPLSDLPA